MTTKLQEARERVREAENARMALTAKFAEEDAAQAPAQTALTRHLKRYSAPVVILTAGSYRIYQDGLASLSGYGWESETRRAMEGYKGKAREARAIELVAAGALTVNLGGSTMKCKGLAQKTRTVTTTHLSIWKRAHEKVRRAEAAAQLARSEEVAAIRAAFDAGARVTVDEVATILGRKSMLQSAVRPPIQWERDRKVKEAREACGAADAHLVHALSKPKDPCPCTRCESERKTAEYSAAAEARRKEQAKAAAAAQRIKDRAPWRAYTCPSCSTPVVAQVLPKVGYLPIPSHDGSTSENLYLRCTVDRCHWSSLASSVKSKPAKKPEATVAA